MYSFTVWTLYLLHWPNSTFNINSMNWSPHQNPVQLNQTISKIPSKIFPTNEYSNYMMQNEKKWANSWSLGDESDFPNHMICTPLLMKGLQVLRLPFSILMIHKHARDAEDLELQRNLHQKVNQTYSGEEHSENFSRKSTRALQQFERSDYRRQNYKYRHQTRQMLTLNT